MKEAKQKWAVLNGTNNDSEQEETGDVGSTVGRKSLKKTNNDSCLIKTAYLSSYLHSMVFEVIKL